MKLQKFAVVGAVVTSLLLAGCGANTAGEVAASTPGAGGLPAGVTESASHAQMLNRSPELQGGSLTVGHFAPVESLDPTTSVGSGASLMRAIYDVLFVYDAKGEVVPELAESLETVDGGTTWNLVLPAGLNFTDGTPFNADAALQHFTNLSATGSKSRSAGDLRQITSMAAVDATTIQFVLQEPNMTFPKVFVWGIPGGPSMIPSPTAVEKFGKDYGSNPVGVGPFMLKSFQSGGDVVLERNPNYRLAGLPHLDELKFVNTTDTQSRMSASIAGDIDMASTQSGVDMAAATAAGLTSLAQPDGNYYNLLFNLNKAPFDDVTFRKAVIQAMDLEGLNKAVFGGTHNVMKGMFPETNPFYKDTGWPSFDLEAAKALVAEYQNSGGTAEFTVTTTSPPEFQKQAAVMQQMLKAAGITMTINVADQPTMVTEALAGNFQAQHRYVDVREEVDQLLRSGYHSNSTGNFSQAGDPAFDALLDELKTEAGQERREEIYAEMQERLTQWLPIMPLLTQKAGWIVGENVGGFPGSRVGVNEPDWRQIWRTSL